MAPVFSGKKKETRKRLSGPQKPRWQSLTSNMIGTRQETTHIAHVALAALRKNRASLAASAAANSDRTVQAPTRSQLIFSLKNKAPKQQPGQQPTGLTVAKDNDAGALSASKLNCTISQLRQGERNKPQEQDAVSNHRKALKEIHQKWDAEQEGNKRNAANMAALSNKDGKDKQVDESAGTKNWNVLKNKVRRRSWIKRLPRLINDSSNTTNQRRNSLRENFKRNKRRVGNTDSQIARNMPVIQVHSNDSVEESEDSEAAGSASANFVFGETSSATQVKPSLDSNIFTTLKNKSNTVTLLSPAQSFSQSHQRTKQTAQQSLTNLSSNHAQSSRDVGSCGELQAYQDTGSKSMDTSPRKRDTMITLDHQLNAPPASPLLPPPYAEDYYHGDQNRYMHMSHVLEETLRKHELSRQTQIERKKRKKKRCSSNGSASSSVNADNGRISVEVVSESSSIARWSFLLAATTLLVLLLVIGLIIYFFTVMAQSDSRNYANYADISSSHNDNL